MFEGVITALVTPFRRDLLDEDALRRLVEEQIAAGVDGLVPVGTTGESPTLTNDEHLRVIEVVIEAAAKRVPVIAGTGSNSTHEAIEMSIAAKRAGADGLLLVTPYYNRPGQEHMYRHFRAIMQAASLPTVVYNVPSRTASDLLPETIERLAEMPELVGVKEATGSALRAAQIIARVGQRIAVLSGDDATAFPLFALGGRGVISVVSNVAPALMSAMWDAAAAGDWNQARQLHYRLLPLGEGLFVEANPIPVKAALAMMGAIDPEVRAPMYAMSGPARERLRAVLAEHGLV